MLTPLQVDFDTSAGGRYADALIGAGYESGSPSASLSRGCAGSDVETPMPSDAGGGGPCDSDADSVPTPPFPVSPDVGPASIFSLRRSAPLQPVPEIADGCFDDSPGPDFSSPSSGRRR